MDDVTQNLIQTASLTLLTVAVFVPWNKRTKPYGIALCCIGVTVSVVMLIVTWPF